jgi:hypothetical protein
MTERNPTMVTIAVSGSGAANSYHTNPDCHALIHSKTRQIAKHKVPNATLCQRCENGGTVGGTSEQSRDIQNFVKNLDATDVARGELADAIREECE